MNTLVCGGIALDDIYLPDTKLIKTVGGSAVYASLAASLFSPTIVGGIIGTDFPADFFDKLSKSRQINTKYIFSSPKLTFRWKGRYSNDLSDLTVLEQRVNAYQDFELDGLVEAGKNCKTVFMSNIDPEIQLSMISLLPTKVVKIVDSMDLWIVEKREFLIEALRYTDVFFIGDKEVNLLVDGRAPLFWKIDQIMNMGPKVVIIKKGENGLTMYGKMGTLSLPSYPLTQPIDPSGAGDSLGGAVAGVLSRLGRLDRGTLTTAVVVGTIVASFVVEGYAFERLESLTMKEIINRTKVFLGQLPSNDLVLVDDLL